MIPPDLPLDESEFEKKRKENMAENKAMMEILFPKGWMTEAKNSMGRKPVSRPRRERSLGHEWLSPRKNPSRSCKRRLGDLAGHGDSNDEGSDSDNSTSLEDGKVSNPNFGFIRFAGWKKKFAKPSHSEAADDAYVVDDSPIENIREGRRSFRSFAAAERRPFDALRAEDLVLVAESTSEKSYDSVDGTTCHQCRQKTDDLKTVCRSESCCGVRGQFCGPCLRNRYGEDAKKAIMDPDWRCPPCRGICNCSFCMKKRGRKATGILIHTARHQGYQDVKSFLGD